MVASKPSQTALIILSIVLLFATLNLVVGHSTEKKKECTCIREEEEHEGEVVDKNVLTYKIVAIFVILGAGALGVFIPILGRNIPTLRPERDAFYLVKAFAAGVILCTAFIHILPEAFENLTSPCLGEGTAWESFPVTGIAVMGGALLTLMTNAFATRHFRLSHDGDHDEEAKDGHFHAHGGASSQVPQGLSKAELIRYRVTSQVHILILLN